MRRVVLVAAALALVLVFWLGTSSFYTVDPTEQVLLLQFGRRIALGPIGQVRLVLRLHFRRSAVQFRLVALERRRPGR